MHERAPNSSCSGAQRGKALAAPPPAAVPRSASDGVRRALWARVRGLRASRSRLRARGRSLIIGMVRARPVRRAIPSPSSRPRSPFSARSVVPLPRAPRHVHDRDERSTRWPRDPSARADCVHQSRIARTRAYEPRGCPLHDGFSSARALLDRRACGRWRLARRARTCCQAPCSRTGRGPGPRVVMGARTNRSVASLLLHPAVRVASSVASLLLNSAVRVGALSCATSSAAHCNDSSPVLSSRAGTTRDCRSCSCSSARGRYGAATGRTTMLSATIFVR